MCSPPSRRTDELVQAPLDVHVQVFQRSVPREIPGLDFLLDDGQTVNYGCGVFLTDDTLLRQHLRVGHRPGDVLPVQAAVIVDGDGVGGEVVCVVHTAIQYSAGSYEAQEPLWYAGSRKRVSEDGTGGAAW